MDAAVSRRQVLGVLADTVPATAARRGERWAAPTEWFRWLPLSALATMAASEEWRIESLLGQRPDSTTVPSIPIDRRFAERLAATGGVRIGASARIGWLWVCGTAEINGTRRRVLHPLITMPVTVRRSQFGAASLVRVGDPTLTSAITEPADRRRLDVLEFGGGALDASGDVAAADLLSRLRRLRAFVDDAAASAGFGSRLPLVGSNDSPEALSTSGGGLRVVAGVAVFLASDEAPSVRGGVLRDWCGAEESVSTAFDHVYGTTSAALHDRPDLVADATYASPFELTPAQAGVVRASSRNAVTVVSGMAGNGKSQTVAAIAADAVSNGHSVLVATKTSAAVDALAQLFGDVPGLSPVVFGSSERRDELAAQLAAAVQRRTAPTDVAATRAEFERADADYRHRWTQVASRLDADAHQHGTVTGGSGQFPGIADILASDDLAALDGLDEDVRAAAHSGWSRRRAAQRALADLSRVCGAPIGVDDLVAVADAARSAREAIRRRDLLQPGGLMLGERWSELALARNVQRAAFSRWLATDLASGERRDRGALGAVGALVTAMRAGRSARRTMLERVGRRLADGLPLWLGSLEDIDELLPALPALFDLVILDEAAGIDQALAAPALLRAARAVVVGDPQQLRHVSFVADAELDAVRRRHDVADTVAAQLDVRRNSIFDAAAFAGEVHTLDEHFRSDPHLVDVVVRRVYHGDVTVATRSPATTGIDCIDVVHVSGTRDVTGVVTAEVAKVMSILQDLRRFGARSVGVVSPFRAQADALEAAALASFTADDIEALGLRIGTVHAFQGNEREVVVASIGVGDAGGQAWRFVEDPNLFAVLSTRARRRFVVVLSGPPPAGGLLDDYLAAADDPPLAPQGREPNDQWTADVVAALRDAGIDVIASYPTGRHMVDIVVTQRDRWLGIETVTHRDGGDAHVQRHLDLVERGWPLFEAFESRWSGRLGELVVEILSALVPAARTPR